jgi:hypothetical protein
MNPHIIDFVSAVRQRLNQARLARLLGFALLVVSLGLTGWCLWYVVQGYAVPRVGYAAAGLVLLGFMGLAWSVGRPSTARAARAADQHFKLKDAIASHLGFAEQGRAGDFVAMQAETTAEKVSQLSAQSIPIAWPRRLLWVACVLMAACFLMAFRQHSPAVLERLALEEQTAKQTEEANEELEEEVEKLLKSASKEERELLKPDEWRRWVKELKQLRDPREAMRQYAELERRLAEAAQKLSQRETEQLLSKAAAEMQQALDLKPIAKALEEKNYRKASEQMQQMSLKANSSTPSSASQEMAKLKSAAQHMASAARNYQQRNPNPSGDEGEKKDGSQRMDQQMLALEKAMQQLQQQMQQQNPNQQQCEQCKKQANDALKQLCQSLCQCAGKRDLQKKLQSLCQCAGQCMNPGSTPREGKKAGIGTLENRREGSDPMLENGNMEQLIGTKGAGPSDTTTEAADSGTGTASQGGGAKEKVWKRQMESFIQREDVPTQVKEGVKEYFKGIQQVGDEKSPKK